MRFLAKFGLGPLEEKTNSSPPSEYFTSFFIFFRTATYCLQSVNDSQFNFLGRLARVRRNSGPGRIDFSTTVAPPSNHLHPGPNG